MADPGNPVPLPSNAARLVVAAALLAIIAPYAWASSRYVVVLLIGWGDGWAHLAAIRRTMDLGPFPGDMFYAGEATPPYYSLSHILFALASRASGVPAHVIFSGLPPLFAALVIVAVFFWLRELTGDVRAALAGAAVELLVALPGAPWSALSFPRNLALLPLYLAWLAYVRGRSGSDLRWLLASGLALGLCLATHLFTGGLCLIGLALHDLALSRGRPRRLAPLLIVGAFGFVVASPWLLSLVVAFRQRQPVPHHVFTDAGDALTLSNAYPWLRIFDPRRLATVVPPALWIGVASGALAVAMRVRGRRTTPADLYAVAGVATAALLTLTPLFSIALSAFGVWTARLVLVAPFSLLYGLGVAAIADGLRAVWPLRLASALLLACMAVAALASLRATATQMPELNRLVREQGPSAGWDLAESLSATGPLPSVVLTDPQTAYTLPYLIGSYVVASPAAHGSSYVDHDSRDKDVRTFFTLYPRLADLRRILDRYDVDAVAIDMTPRSPDQPPIGPVLEGLRRMLPELVDTGCCGNLLFLRREPKKSAP